MRKFLACATLSAGIALAGTASAATWPTSVQGIWGGPANSSNMQFNFTLQKATGKCPTIYGVITDLTYNLVGSMLGFYCPDSGRIVFQRKDATGHLFQVFRGNVSQIVPNTLKLMSGTFVDYGQNSKITFPFNAQK